jgi:hypothetical protein
MKTIRYTIAVASMLLGLFGTHAIFKYGIKMHSNPIEILIAGIVLYTIISIPVIHALKTKWRDSNPSSAKMNVIICISGLIGMCHAFSLFRAGYLDSHLSPAGLTDVVVLPGETITMKVSLLSVPEGCYRTTGQGFVQMNNTDIFPVPIPIEYTHSADWGNTIKSKGHAPGRNPIKFTAVEIPVSLSLPRDLIITEPVELHGTVVMPLYYAKI